MARVVEEYRVEYREAPTDSMGNALAWRTIARATQATELLVTGLTNGDRGQFRLLARNAGGTTVGPILDVEAIGQSKVEGRIAVVTTADGEVQLWFDDPYAGPGPLWGVRQYYVRTRDGRGFYTYDRIEMEEDDTVEDPQDRVVWLAGGTYDFDQHVVTQDRVSVGSVILQFQFLWRCLVPHRSVGNSDGPTENAKGYWEFVTNWYDQATALPPPPAASPAALPITARTTILMNKMDPNDDTNEENRPQGPGEYKFGSRAPGYWESYNEWADIVGSTRLVVMSLTDRDGVDGVPTWQHFHGSLGEAVHTGVSAYSDFNKLVVRYSAGKWVSWTVTEAWLSGNRRRCNLTVNPKTVQWNADDNDDDIPTDRTLDVSFLFGLGTPTTS